MDSQAVKDNLMKVLSEIANIRKLSKGTVLEPSYREIADRAESKARNALDANRIAPGEPVTVQMYKDALASFKGLASSAKEFGFQSSVSFKVDAVIKSTKEAVKEAPKVLGNAVGSVASGIGDTAGSLLGGLFSGLGIIWTVLIVAVLVFMFFPGAIPRLLGAIRR